MQQGAARLTIAAVLHVSCCCVTISEASADKRKHVLNSGREVVLRLVLGIAAARSLSGRKDETGFKEVGREGREVCFAFANCGLNLDARCVHCKQYIVQTRVQI